MRRAPVASVVAALLLAPPAPGAAHATLVHSAQAVAAPANVLLLHSYHEGFAWSDNITRGVARVLAGAGRPSS